MSDEPHALLERLVGQFAEPYDFLRELIQNAMDAGSDLVEVELHEHPGDHPAQVVFELVVVDGGAGMDEEIIDGELTRLFGTSKADDRTMAGGFGIGFVSVFAWEPERVLLQTGRHGQAWELLFHEDRRFEKRPVDMPLEGTSIRMFRRGAPSQRRSIAEAVEDALRRWCRFAPIEVTFEDVGGGGGVQEIAEAFAPHDVAAHVSWTRGPSRAELGFGAEPEAVLLRRGLVLEEGRSAELLPSLAEAVGPSTMQHLVVRLDSPQLETGLSRDGAIRSAHRDGLEDDLVSVVTQLRGALAERVGEAASRPTWGADAANVYSHLHAHLALEYDDVEHLERRPILRLATGSSVSAETLSGRARLGFVAVADDDPPEHRLLALRSGVPVLQGRWSVDSGWLSSLLARVDLRLLRLGSAVCAATPLATPEALADRTLALVREVAPLGGLQWGDLHADDPDVLGGVAVAESGVVTGAVWTEAVLRGRTLWLRASHPLVRRAEATAIARLDVAALGLAFAILARGDVDPGPMVERWRSSS